MTALVIGIKAHSQTGTIDRLRKIIYTTADDKQKSTAVFAYLNEYESLPTDSFLHYYNKALEISRSVLTEERKLELRK